MYTARHSSSKLMFFVLTNEGEMFAGLLVPFVFRLRLVNGFVLKRKLDENLVLVRDNLLEFLYIYIYFFVL